MSRSKMTTSTYTSISYTFRLELRSFSAKIKQSAGKGFVTTARGVRLLEVRSLPSSQLEGRLLLARADHVVSRAGSDWPTESDNLFSARGTRGPAVIGCL